MKTGPNVLITAIFFSIATLVARNTTISPNYGRVMRQIRQVESSKNMTWARQCVDMRQARQSNYKVTAQAVLRMMYLVPVRTITVSDFFFLNLSAKK